MVAKNFIVHTKIALLTKHDKQNILSPILQSAFTTSLIHTDKFDTDSLGSFDNKILREVSAVDSAIRKAYLACELTGLEQGLGSEGSFNSVMGLGVLDEEFIAFVDTKQQIEIIASAKQGLPLGAIEARTREELASEFARYQGGQELDIEQPSQKWMLKQDQQWVKGLSPEDVLANAKQFPVYLEPDFRAMHCPLRQNVIKIAAHDLIHRLKALCPQCAAPNFVAKIKAESIKYLACELCGQATNRVGEASCICDLCGYLESPQTRTETTSAFYCGFCNP